MKLLVINWQDRTNPQAGGAETHLHEIFGRLATLGDEVTLLASGHGGAAQLESLDGIEVHRVGGRHTFGLRCRAYYERHLARRGFDVVVEDLNKVPVFSPRWAQSPVVLLVHHLFGTTAFREATPPVAAATWLLERPVPRIYRDVPVQTVSESTAADLVSRGMPRAGITVIHNGIDLDFFAPDAAAPRAPEPMFVFVGRLKRYKNVDVAIRAVAELRDAGVHARLIIAGCGSDEPRLRSLVRRLHLGDRAAFEGFVTEERKRELFRTAWSAVLPSSKEGWGITNIEAGACNTPAIAADAPGLRESVVDGVTGTLVPVRDAGAMAAAMRRMIDSPERVARMGNAARQFAGHFSWDAAARRTREHLAAAADPRHRGRVAPSSPRTSAAAAAE